MFTKGNFYNEGLTKSEVQSIINNTPNIKNVQPDWQEGDDTKDSFIKGKPIYLKRVESSAIYKICNIVKNYELTLASRGIELLFRRGAGGILAKLLYGRGFSLYFYPVSDISVNANTVRFYYVETSSNIEIYANSQSYCALSASPINNVRNNYIDFSEFGNVLESLPSGATEITPKFVASSSGSSLNNPVKVDGYGNLTPVTMDNYPTPGSTGLVNSGKLYDVFTDDNGDQMTETPPQQYYVTGKFYFVSGKVCRCTAYSAETATFDVYGVVEALNYVLSQT